MKRAKVGDVYYIKVPNGYKLYQWAYSIPKDGDYIRVFPGLYQEIPKSIAEIVEGSHSYIAPFRTKRAYRIGLSELIGNYPVPEKYPFPDYMVSFSSYSSSGKVFNIRVMGTNWGLGNRYSYDVSSMEELPMQYRNIKLLNACVSPSWLLYLFDIDFDLTKLEKFWPGPNVEERLQPYTDIVNSFWRKN